MSRLLQYMQAPENAELIIARIGWAIVALTGSATLFIIVAMLRR